MITSFVTKPINLIGGSYAGRSRHSSAQVTRNLYPELVPTGATPSALFAWPGGKGYLSGSGISNRGTGDFDGLLYKVTDDTLYSVTSEKIETAITGTIADSGPVTMVSDGIVLVITTDQLTCAFLNNQVIFGGGDGRGYIYNVANGLQEITDPDFGTTGGQFQVANVGDASNINALNFATAESSPDDLTRVYTFRESLYLFGTESIESWYNSGIGNPPFDKITSGVMPIGLIAKYSVSSNDDFMYFLGSDKNVYRVSAYHADPVLDPATAHQFESYVDVSDAKGYCLHIEGQNFYYLTFPSANRSWCYSESTKTWFELSFTAELDRSIADSYIFFYNKHLIASRLNGDILEWDLNTFTDDGQTIIRERISPPIDGTAIGKPGARIMMSKVTFILETGVGLATGQGSNPKIMAQASFDGGKSQTNEDWIDIGRTGESRKSIEWYHMESAYQIQVRIRMSDAVFMGLLGATIDLKFAGW